MAYMFPLRANDLGLDQRYDTFDHALGPRGMQAEGKDIGARWHKSDTSWPWLRDGAKAGGEKYLINWVVYDRPFYAMAAGTVVAGWRMAPDNTPGSYSADYDPGGKIAGGGNHLWILQDNGVYALYAHAREGSIPLNLGLSNARLLTGSRYDTGNNPDILPECEVTAGIRVQAGQKLGHIGNSGATKQGPHLHVHMEKDGHPVVMNFERGMTTPFPDRSSAKFYGPWTRLKGNALPNANVLVWAPHSVANYTFKGTTAAEYKGLFDHMSDSGMMPDKI
jgi:Peptidase family M23